MKNIFQIPRFGKFLKMEFLLHKKMFLVLMGLTLISLIVDMATFSATADILAQSAGKVDENAAMNGITAVNEAIEQFGLGVNPLQIGGAFGILLYIIPLILYNFVYHPTKSLTYSMLPASWLEKFSSAWLLCVVIVPVLLSGFSLLVALLGDLSGVPINWSFVNLKTFLSDYFLPTICIQSIAFWGAFWFKDKKIGKTILCLVAVLIIVLLIMRYAPFGNSFIKELKEHSAYSYALMIVLWALAFVKFPRTQI